MCVETAFIYYKWTSLWVLVLFPSKKFSYFPPSSLQRLRINPYEICNLSHLWPITYRTRFIGLPMQFPLDPRSICQRHKSSDEAHWRMRCGQKVSIFCVCGGTPRSLVGRNNKSAGKGNTNIQLAGNINPIRIKMQIKTKQELCISQIKKHCQGRWTQTIDSF